jgi:hypothetical protein
VLTNLGADGDIGEGEVLGVNLGCMKDMGVEGRGKVLRVVVQALDRGNIREKILTTKFGLWDPDVVVDDRVEMGMSVLDGGAGQDGEQVGVVGAEVVVASFNW